MTAAMTPPAIGIIDVIIAAYNSAETIERAISSVMNDPAVNRVIVVDDASSDDTLHRAQQMAVHNARICVLRAGFNKGPSAARNMALAQSTAPWITPLDSDDFIRPGRFKTLLGASENHDFIADDPIRLSADAPTDSAGAPMLGLSGALDDLGLATFVRANIGRRGRLRREMGFLKPIMRRAFLNQHAVRYTESVRLGEDFLLYAQALAAGARFRLIPAAGYVAVMRPASLSGTHGSVELEAFRNSALVLLGLPSLSRKERSAIRAHLQHLNSKIQWLKMIDAVKSRDLRNIIRSFTLSPIVAGSVARNLADEALKRVRTRLRNHASAGRQDFDV